MKKSFVTDIHIRIFGVAESYKGCGSTHFSLLLANYLSNVIGARVIVCNFGDNQEYKRASVLLGGNEDVFTYNDITFMISANMDKLITATNEYDYIVADLSYDETVYNDIFSRCDRGYFVGQINEWNLDDTVTRSLILNNIFKDKVTYLAMYGSKRCKKLFTKILGQEIYLIPHETNPLCLHREMLTFLEMLINGRKS